MREKRDEAGLKGIPLVVGGNTECILHNARMLADSKPDFPIVVAGNRTAARQCQRILEGCEVYLCPNVMPKFGVLNIEPTQKQIREFFLNRIIQAKGLSKAAELLSDIMMPTPSAVLAAMELLSRGCEGEAGIGELVAVDVSGATTDIYSIADSMPEAMNTEFKGLPEPYAKRTKEIARHALYSPAQPASLRPRAADVWVDKTYILAAMGLLSSHYPAVALRIMKKELEYHGHSE